MIQYYWSTIVSIRYDMHYPQYKTLTINNASRQKDVALKCLYVYNPVSIWSDRIGKSKMQDISQSLVYWYYMGCKYNNILV